jgi:hypothetical protein
MLQSYLLLLKELAKHTYDEKFNFNLFYSQILKTYLNIDSFLRSENNFAIEVKFFNFFPLIILNERIYFKKFSILINQIRFSR